MYLVDDEVAFKEELTDVDRCGESADMGERVRLSFCYRVNYSHIAEVDGKVGKC